ncbi:hypothetical protein [Variovorax sp.]|jgi:hypothetical protein
MHRFLFALRASGAVEVALPRFTVFASTPTFARQPVTSTGYEPGLRHRL